MAKLSHNAHTHNTEKLVFNSDSEEQCTSKVSDIKLNTDHSDDTATINKLSHNKNCKERNTEVQLYISYPALKTNMNTKVPRTSLKG
jgi:hypothetical protein